MVNLFLYAHGGSGNHGCEAIVCSSTKMLSNIFPSQPTLFSYRPDEDKNYGLSDCCTIKNTVAPYSKLSFPFLKAYLSLKIKRDFIPMDKMPYLNAFNIVQNGDIAFSIGGDNYCYADVQKYIMLQDLMLDRRAKTVLWGCSVDPQLLKDTSIASDLSRYSLITARETLTYNAFKQVNPNTVLVADPAFTLVPSPTALPPVFEPHNTVGLNISPMAIALESQPGITLQNYTTLIKYILNHTDMTVALIPHVVWEGGDDRIPLHSLFEHFKDTGKIVEVPDHNCQELKYIISQCRFFIGARTHATIAAYSTCVPTLVLGYSIKSRGIAQDIFGSHEKYVIPVQSLTSPEALTEQFKWMMGHESDIKHHLQVFMPEYITKADATSYLNTL